MTSSFGNHRGRNRLWVEEPGIPVEERKRRLDWAVERFDLEDYVDLAPKSLSRGLRTKTAIASILSMQPSVLVVDEPTTGLGRRESLEIMQVLESLTDSGTTVIFITHEMDLVAQFARRAVVMHAGKILLGGPTEVVFSELQILRKPLFPCQTFTAWRCCWVGKTSAARGPRWIWQPRSQR